MINFLLALQHCSVCLQYLAISTLPILNRTIEKNLVFWLVNKVRYLAWNCVLKTRLSDIVSHLCMHNNYKQYCFLFCLIITQLCNSRRNHYLSCEFRVKLYLKTNIVLIASRFMRYWFLREIKYGILSSSNEFFNRILYFPHMRDLIHLLIEILDFSFQRICL